MERDVLPGGLKRDGLVDKPIVARLDQTVSSMANYLEHMGWVLNLGK